MKTISYEELQKILQRDNSEFFLEGDKNVSMFNHRITDKTVCLYFAQNDRDDYEHSIFGYTKYNIVITVDRNNVMLTDSDGNEKVCRFSVYNLVPAEL